MAKVKEVIDLKAGVPEAVLMEIEAAAKRPIALDEEFPELTEVQLQQIADLAKRKRAERVKKVVALRLSPATLEKAQKLGRGYTGILSRIIENALNNPELLKQCL